MAGIKNLFICGLVAGSGIPLAATRSGLYRRYNPEELQGLSAEMSKLGSSHWTGEQPHVPEQKQSLYPNQGPSSEPQPHVPEKKGSLYPNLGPLSGHDPYPNLGSSSGGGHVPDQHANLYPNMNPSSGITHLTSQHLSPQENHGSRYPETGVTPKYPGIDGAHYQGSQFDSGYKNAQKIYHQTHSDLLESKPPRVQDAYQTYLDHQKTFKRLDSMKKHATEQNSGHEAWTKERDSKGPDSEKFKDLNIKAMKAQQEAAQYRNNIKMNHPDMKTTDFSSKPAQPQQKKRLPFGRQKGNHNMPEPENHANYPGHPSLGGFLS